MQTSSDANIAVHVDNISKQYRLGTARSSIREVVSGLGRKILGRPSADAAGSFWALRNVSFDVKRGEALGIIGANGAGKTTILKILSRITKPTEGDIQLFGRFSSLIELGAGFHPELTGRENVLLNGVILGLSQNEVRKRFDQIVAFSELERFIDMPVKRYSSGMFARLGFAVAAHVDPDIMLVDEVLAVGDMSFQQKCYDLLTRFVRSGKTTVFISHNLFVIEQLCDRVVWLERGQVKMDDIPQRVLSGYLDSQEQRILEAAGKVEAEGSQDLWITGVDTLDAEGKERDWFAPDEDIVVRVRYATKGVVERPHFVVSISDGQGGSPLIIASMLVDSAAPSQVEGAGEMLCHFRSVPLRQRAYLIWGEVYDADRTRLLVNWQRLGSFRVVDESIDAGQAARGSIRHSRTDAPIRVPYEWKQK